MAEPSSKAFVDTNVIVYFASDEDKTATSERLLKSGGVVSVQVLNEFVSVARRKMGLTFEEIRFVLDGVRKTCAVVSVTVETHELGLRIAERYKLNVYDAMILAAAKLAGCEALYSEDMRDGAVIEGVRVKDPYA